MRKNKVDDMCLQIDNVDFWSGHEKNKGGMRIYWSGNVGFGTLDIVKRNGNDGEDFKSPYEELMLTAHTECMDNQDDKTFTRKILDLLVNCLKIID